MERILIALVLVLTLQAEASAQVRVDGYMRRDGTYVAPHYRSRPDNSYNNNWGVSPNTNPYTGQAGRDRPTWNDRPPPGQYGTGGLYGGRRW